MTSEASAEPATRLRAMPKGYSHLHLVKSRSGYDDLAAVRREAGFHHVGRFVLHPFYNQGVKRVGHDVVQPGAVAWAGLNTRPNALPHPRSTARSNHASGPHQFARREIPQSRALRRHASERMIFPAERWQDLASACPHFLNFLKETTWTRKAGGYS